MKAEFFKMHGAGNDYVFFDCIKTDVLGYISDNSKRPENIEKFVSHISKRRFSIGGDGAVFICPSNVADVKMRMFNADGSEGKMCGNAIRCIGRYVYENLFKKTDITVETLSGVKKLKIISNDKSGCLVSVDMGKADFSLDKIPMKTKDPSDKDFVLKNLLTGVKEYTSTALSVGNPHVVIFTDDTDKINIEIEGKAIENHPFFPERVNVEFAKIIDTHTVKMRVWERGSGETLSCGTGACATVAAGVKNGFLKYNEPIKVILKGGELSVTCTDGFCLNLTGNAEKTYGGVYEI